MFYFNCFVLHAEATKSKVFIVHDKNCDLCEEVTHSFVDVLNQTGCITCILDLRCTKEIVKCGMSWYEQQLKNCEKVLVICSKEGRKILHEKENKKCTFNRLTTLYLSLLYVLPDILFTCRQYNAERMHTFGNNRVTI